MELPYDATFGLEPRHHRRPDRWDRVAVALCAVDPQLGKPANVIQLKNGYFEIQLLKAFFEGNPVMVSRINFYR